MHEDKRVEGAVSLWVGVSASQDALENYAEIDYSDNLSPHVSRFADDFGVGWHDEDFMEVGAEKPTRSLSVLLRGCSYDSIVIPKFVEQRGDLLPKEANAFVLLYNFQHNGSPGSGANVGGPVMLQYMGSIKVEMPWPD